MLRFARQLMSGALCVALLATSALAQEGAAAPSPDLTAAILRSVGADRGLIVVAGSAAPTVWARALAAEGDCLVHVLCETAEEVARCRAAAGELDRRGILTADLRAADLPYPQRTVNTLVAPKFEGSPALEEILRVLQPGGAAWLAAPAAAVRQNLAQHDLSEQAELSEQTHGARVWTLLRRLRPASLDTWSQPRHDATGNAVSTDTEIGAPRGVRWAAGPQWPAGYRKNAVPAVVSGPRQLVYVLQDDESGQRAGAAQESLVARDAHNGLRLWKRRSESTQLAIVDSSVFTIVGSRLVRIDAATGAIEKTFEELGNVVQIWLHQGRLLCQGDKELSCISHRDGQIAWRLEARPAQLVCGGDSVYLHLDHSRRGGKSELVSLRLADGQPRWTAPVAPWSKASPKLLLYSDETLVLAGDAGNHCVSAVDGKHLWHYAYERIGHGGSYEKVLALEHLIWVHVAKSADSPGYAWLGLDPQTGQVQRSVAQPKDFAMKHRCNYDVATPRLMLCGSMDFANLETGEYEHFGAARNSCSAAGVLPANGLIYTFPHACGCYAMLRGILALTDDPPLADADDAAAAPQFGPARNAPGKPFPPGWSAYRGGSLRSAAAITEGPPQLARLWQRPLTPPPAAAADERPWSEWRDRDGGLLTAPTVAGGLALVSRCDQHQVAAFDVATGQPRWTFEAGGRLDSPPTIAGPWCLFGGRDGMVYCLRAEDGKLAWQRPVPGSRQRIVAHGQLESARPVSGPVLVEDGTVYCVTGRHQASAGGLRVVALELETGRQKWEREPSGHDGVPDVLAASQGVLQMGLWRTHISADATGSKEPNGKEPNGKAPNGKAPNGKTARDKTASDSAPLLRGGRLGLLNDAWYRHPIAMRKSLQAWVAPGRPAAQLLAFRGDLTGAYRACQSVLGANGVMVGDGELSVARGKESLWRVPLANTSRITALAIAGDRLYAAGEFVAVLGEPPVVALRAYRLSDGALEAEAELPSRPVHDGIAIDRGRLIVASSDGSLLCFGGSAKSE